jgi:hypothetical protein
MPAFAHLWWTARAAAVFEIAEEWQDAITADREAEDLKRATEDPPLLISERSANVLDADPKVAGNLTERLDLRSAGLQLIQKRGSSEDPWLDISPPRQWLGAISVTRRI